MIRVCSVCILRIKFNIDLSFSEMRRLYRIKFINAYYTERESEREREREKERDRERKRDRQRESGWVGESSSNELWKLQFNETNSAGRVFPINYVYICLRFLIYEILLWQLLFVIKIRLLNNDKIILPKKLVLCSRFSDFVLPSFFLSWLLLILQKKLVFDKF